MKQSAMCKDLLKIIDESAKVETNGTIIEKTKKYSNIFDIFSWHLDVQFFYKWNRTEKIHVHL